MSKPESRNMDACLRRLKQELVGYGQHLSCFAFLTHMTVTQCVLFKHTHYYVIKTIFLPNAIMCFLVFIFANHVSNK